MTDVNDMRLLNALQSFNSAMYKKLALPKNIQKGHWSGMTDWEILHRVLQEVGELTAELIDGTPITIQLECVDVSNFCMMMFDNQTRKR